MEINTAYYNLEQFEKKHTEKWIPNMAPYKTLACLDFGNSYFDTTDIDSTQLAKDLSCQVIYEEKFYAHNEFINPNSLQVQKRMLTLADRANVPAFLILTSRRYSNGIVCGNPETGIDWPKYIGTISALYNAGDISSAKLALGNGLADIYSESNVIAIIPNNAAKKHEYKNKRREMYLLNYEKIPQKVTVEIINSLIKAEFPGL